MSHRGAVLSAIGLGLVGGVLLSAPLSSLISPPPEGGSVGLNLSNPFTGWAGGAEQDLLVLGTDEGGGNTDVITLVRVEGGVTHVTQIPRDAYIESQRWGPLKINALYGLGGVEELKRELSERLGRRIAHHLIVDLGSLRRLADLMGGIEVVVPKRMYYVDNSQGLMIDLQPGRQTLKGRSLEGFLRFRHDEAGDLGRLQRQQLALQALFHKLGRPESLVRLPSLLLATRKEIRTDLGPMELGGLATAMGSTRLETERLQGRPFDRQGISYLAIDWPVQPEGSSDGEDGVGLNQGRSPAAADPETAPASKAQRPQSRYLF